MAVAGFDDHRRARSASPPLAEESHQTVRRFAWTLGMVLGWAYLTRDRLPEHGLAVLLVTAALTTAVIGSFLKEPFRGPSLNRWDEALAYCCLAYLAHFAA